MREALLRVPFRDLGDWEWLPSTRLPNSSGQPKPPRAVVSTQYKYVAQNNCGRKKRPQSSGTAGSAN